MRKKNKPLTKDQKTIWISSLFVSMLFLFSNLKAQSLLDVIFMLVFTMSLLFVPLFIYMRYC